MSFFKLILFLYKAERHIQIGDYRSVTFETVFEHNERESFLLHSMLFMLLCSMQ